MVKTNYDDDIIIIIIKERSSTGSVEYNIMNTIVRVFVADRRGSAAAVVTRHRRQRRRRRRLGRDKLRSRCACRPGSLRHRIPSFWTRRAPGRVPVGVSRPSRFFFRARPTLSFGKIVVDQFPPPFL